MNTQYRKNLKDAMTVCKNYTDKKIDDLRWELGSHTLDVSSDTTTAYTKTVPSGAIGCQINKIGGMSYKYNQLVQNGNFESTDNWGAYSGTISASDNVVTFTMTTAYTGGGNNYMNQSTTSTVVGHTYLSYCEVYIPSSNARLTAVTAGCRGALITPSSQPTDKWFAISGVVTISTANNIFLIAPNTATSVDDYIMARNCMCIDLTAIYGSGNEPTDVATATTELLKRGIDINEYQAYDSGSIRDSAVTSVVSKGANLWDEQWELGSYDSNGLPIASVNTIRNKNAISVLPNTTYYGKQNLVLYFYDNNNTFISNIIIKNSTFTTPIGCKYMNFRVSSDYGTTYKNDIMIVKGSTAPSEYLPYVEPTEYPIASEIQALEGYGWGINDTCYNYIDYEAKKFIQKAGRVDLGSLRWSKDGDNRFYSRYGNDLKPNTDTTLIPNIICSKYNAVTYNNIDSRTKEGITIINSNNIASIFIYDTNYNDTTTFQIAMSGVYLYYELAEPVETDISEYLDDNSIEVEPLGTLTFTNTYEQAVPSDIDYLIEEVKA